MAEELLEAEAVEEDAVGDEAIPSASALPARRESGTVSEWKDEARSVALAAAGGIVAGAATVAMVKAASRAAAPKPSRRRLIGRDKPQQVVASRSFLVDVHLLGK